ncbi:hypothetical protein B0H67DRAFT_482881 [Lasiosphaeris hirsuta]|uniref:Uncharacterized protein n=1 Tax=Lasiosphaeris hirsuta TaxID=260670 RepID=A0AA40AZI2_9PEZI|nr:hypothetical protein B0H67DRAFT_482881 [Lasiosphaeris hirsuta]
MDTRLPQERRGPQIYVHVEFGVSWTKKAPKNHEVTYKSRGLRERTPHFPRQVPAPNTNYLSAIRDFEERQSQYRQPRHLHLHPSAHSHDYHNQHSHHQLQEYYQTENRQHRRHHQPLIQEQPRMSRAESRSSHERGRSAPPPIGDNPWDVSIFGDHAAGPESSALQTHLPADQWKALPAEPSKFRLGEGGMPWSAWSNPLEYDPNAYDRDDEDETMSTRSGPAVESLSPYATNPGMVSVFSPGPMTTQPADSGRARELGALSAAMMTVDNGFEHQWWNNGPREAVAAGDLRNQNAQNLFSAASLGWSAVDTLRDEEQSLVGASLVSPLSESELSPPPAFQSLHRSLSTRSEELWR